MTVVGTAWYSRHAHVGWSIYPREPFYYRVWAVANVWQQMVGNAATVRTFYFMRSKRLMKTMHAQTPFLTDYFLIQWFVIEFVSAF